jgi:RNA polymerase sigma factor (sigma-70 family)
MIVSEKTLDYIKKAKMPLLPSEREKELGNIIQFFKAGQQKGNAINELIRHSLLLVVKLAFKYSNKTGMSLDELIGAGNLGLAKSARLYNPSKFNTRFSTYATFWITEEILRYINNNSHSVTIPFYLLDLHRKHQKEIEDGPIDDKDLMLRLKMSAAVLRKIKMAKTSSVSLETHIKNDGDKDILLKDIIEDETAICPYKKIERDGEFEVLYAAIDELDEVSKEVVLSRYLTDDENQLKKVGKKLNLSAERVRQISKSALDKLRRKISEKRISE